MASHGNLLIEIISGSNLPAVDSGSADPFVVVTGGDGLTLSFSNPWTSTMEIVSADDGSYAHHRGPGG
jgi:hypothetical protein